MIRTRTRVMKAAAVAAIGFLIAGVSVTTAIAAPVTTSVVRTDAAPRCVPRDAVAYQAAVYTTVRHDAVVETVYDRYSWTPGNHDNEEDAPDVTASTPISDPNYWQVDSKHDPKDDPIGSAFKKGHGDNASWFYWLGHQEVVKAAYDEQVLVTPEVKAVEAVYCQIAIYVYKKLDPSAPAAWENSGPQTFIAMKNGTATGDWYKSLSSLPAEVCGTGWGYQQDASKSSTPVDFAGATMAYPYSSLVWPPIYAAKHGELSSLITVPACPPVLTEVTAVEATFGPICGPDNDTVTIPTTEGVTYADTGWSGGERTITATADAGYVLSEGTHEWTFYDEAIACPIEVTAVAVSIEDPPVCGPDNDMVTIPDIVGVTYTDTGWSGGERTITATADAGYVLSEGTHEWTFSDAATLCGEENTGAEVTTVAPTVAPKCFPNNDTVTIPEVEGVIYSDSGWLLGVRTITATAAEGYTLLGDVEWTFTDVPSAGCPDVGPVFAADELAFTGNSSNTGGLVALAILMITSGTAVVTRKRFIR